jgi:hypothetical protein
MQNPGRVKLSIPVAIALCALGLAGFYTRHRQAVEQAEKVDALKAEIRQLSVTADMAYGNRQVAQMLVDRPAMSAYTTRDGEERRVTEKDWIWQWAAAHYGQMINGERVAWDRREPDKSHFFSAEHYIPRPGSVGLIRIRNYVQNREGETRPAAFEELWSTFSFEMLNTLNASGFLEVYNRALHGNLSRDDWVRGYTMLEYKTELKHIDFFQSTWVPWAKQNNYPYDKTIWHLDIPRDYEGWIQKYKSSANDPYLRFYQDYYDNVIVPYRKDEKAYQDELREWKRLHGTGHEQPQ